MSSSRKLSSRRGLSPALPLEDLALILGAAYPQNAQGKLEALALNRRHILPPVVQAAAGSSGPVHRCMCAARAAREGWRSPQRGHTVGSVWPGCCCRVSPKTASAAGLANFVMLTLWGKRRAAGLVSYEVVGVIVAPWL